MSGAANLFKLQRIDGELDGHRGRLSEIAALLGSDAEMQQARAKLEAAGTVTAEARRALGLVQDDIEQVTTKRKNSETRLYSGTVKNPKELQDLQSEVEALGRRLDTLEERELEALIELEDAEAVEAAARQAFETASERWADAQSDLTAEKARREQEAARLEDEREAALIPVRAADRELYEQVRAAKGAVAVTRVEDGICTGCGMAPSSTRIQQARNSDEIVRCGNCGRILYAD